VELKEPRTRFFVTELKYSTASVYACNGYTDGSYYIEGRIIPWSNIRWVKQSDDTT
jgi:hypothetical protein